MKKINIITPFSRDQNLSELLLFIQKHLKNIRWIPVCVPSKKVQFDTIIDTLYLRESVYPYYIEEVPNVDICYYKINKALDATNFNHTSDDYYTVMMDDDLYENNVFEEIVKHEEDVVFISMKRGDQIPDDGQWGHGTSTLNASPSDIRACNTGCPQVFVKGSIMQNERFASNNSGADGIFAETIKNKYNCAYRPDLYALFNYLQPGRYNK